MNWEGGVFFWCIYRVASRAHYCPVCKIRRLAVQCGEEEVSFMYRQVYRSKRHSNGRLGICHLHNGRHCSADLKQPDIVDPPDSDINRGRCALGICKFEFAHVGRTYYLPLTLIESYRMVRTPSAKAKRVPLSQLVVQTRCLSETPDKTMLKRLWISERKMGAVLSFDLVRDNQRWMLNLSRLTHWVATCSSRHPYGAP